MTLRPDFHYRSRLGFEREGVISKSQALCASCTEIRSPHVRRPLGKGDALVSICLDCDAGDLRSGRWDFSARDISRTPRWLADGCRRAPHTGRRA